MILTYCGLMTLYGTEIWVNIGSGNGLLPDGTKPLPEPMLTYHQRGSVALSWEQFHRKCSRYQFVKLVWNYNFKIISTFPRGQWVKYCNSLQSISNCMFFSLRCWGHKKANNLQGTFSNALFWKKISWFQFHLTLFVRVGTTINLF